MKALKSERAKLLLADPQAREQLRRFMMTHPSAAAADEAPVLIHLRRQDGRVEVLQPRIVPKAA